VVRRQRASLYTAHEATTGRGVVFFVVVVVLLVVVLLVIFVVVVLLVVVAALVALALPRSGGTGAAASIVDTLASGQLGREGRIFGALATGIAAIGLGGAG
jgi:Na+/glutamate symporter